MNKEKIKALFSRKEAAKRRAEKKANMQWRNLNQANWNTVSIILLVVTAIWHLQNLLGWLNGKTLVQLYGVNELLADAIAKSPDILFNTTYYCLVISLGVTAFVLYMIYRALFDKDTAQDALTPVLYSSIVFPWVFPTVHIVADMVATAKQVRTTMMFDVFQLNMDMLPTCAITIISLLLVWLNKNIDNL